MSGLGHSEEAKATAVSHPMRHRPSVSTRAKLFNFLCFLPPNHVTRFWWRTSKVFHKFLKISFSFALLQLVGASIPPQYLHKDIYVESYSLKSLHLWMWTHNICKVKELKVTMKQKHAHLGVGWGGLNKHYFSVCLVWQQPLQIQSGAEVTWVYVKRAVSKWKLQLWFCSFFF